MIVTWNVRGMNKEARHKDIYSSCSEFQVPIIALLETRVKNNNAEKIRNCFGNKWTYAKNYMDHDNGRIWLIWNQNFVNIKIMQTMTQLIHVEYVDLIITSYTW